MFSSTWESTEIPEYDLDTDELVYRGNNGSEIRRERFGPEEAFEGVRQGVENLGLTPEASTARRTRGYDAELLPDALA